MARNLVAETWRLEKSRYAMMGNKCVGCNIFNFPSKQICIKCGSNDLHHHHFSGNGTLIEWTKIYEPARGFELFAPMYYGIVELEEGVRTSVQITSVTDESKLVPGIKTKMVFRKLFSDGKQGIVTYGFKAEPIFD